MRSHDEFIPECRKCNKSVTIWWNAPAIHNSKGRGFIQLVRGEAYVVFSYFNTKLVNDSPTGSQEPAIQTWAFCLASIFSALIRKDLCMR